MKKLILILLMLTSFILAQEGESKLQGTAPNFELENMDGDIYELSDFLGKGPVLISFWATWCKPCIEELKAYNKIYEEYEEEGFTIIAISTDSERSIAKVKPFISSMNYDFPVLLDPNSDIARQYYARVMPFSVMIDKAGNILYSHVGYSRGDELKVEDIVKKQLEKNKSNSL